MYFREFLNLFRAGREGQGKEIVRQKIRQPKRGRGGRGVWGEFRLARASKFSVRIFAKKSSDFVQRSEQIKIARKATFICSGAWIRTRNLLVTLTLKLLLGVDYIITHMGRRALPLTNKWRVLSLEIVSTPYRLSDLGSGLPTWGFPDFTLFFNLDCSRKLRYYIYSELLYR